MESGEPWSSVIDALKERGHLETDTWVEGHVRMGADMGGCGYKPANAKDGQEPTEAVEQGCGQAQATGEGLTPPPGALFRLLVPEPVLCLVQSHGH